jgi:O-antigen/teichoic acid export membrane protein
LAIISILVFLIFNIINTSSKLEWGIILIFSAIALLSLDLQPVYDALQKMQRHAIYFLIQKACYLLIVWFMILFFPNHFSVLWIGMAMLFASLLYLLMQHRWAINHIASYTLTNNTLISDIRWLINKNWLIWLAAICGLVAVMLNQPILKYYAGDSELGGYAAAWQVMMIGHLFVDQLGRFGRPGMARYTRPEITNDNLIRFLFKYSVAMTGVALPLTISMIFIPDFIFQLLFKPEYAAASKTLPVFGSYLLLFALGVVASQYVLSVRLEKIYFFSVLIGGLTSVFLCYLIIPEYKSIGAAWVLLLAHGSSLLVYAIAMVRHIQEHS